MAIRTLDDLVAEGAALGVRIDINSPLDDSELADDARLRAHLATLSELTDRGGRVAVLAHQGRPGGDAFSDLHTHAERLDELLDAPVEYVDGTFCADAREHVREISNGGVLVLENTRFYSEECMEFDPERAAQTHLVRKLAPVFDAYVNDAFAAAHRSQPSLVGFPEHLPSYAGRVMERELDVLGSIEETDRPRVYVLGGVKVSDSLHVAETVLRRGLADAVLTAGLVGNVFLCGSGVALGEASMDIIEERGHYGEIDRAADLLDTYPETIHTPTDVAVERNGDRSECALAALPAEGPILDIGTETIEAYAETLANAETAILNGPAGVYEREAFAVGTSDLYRAATHAGYTIVGGGDTAAALRHLGVTGFDHVSTGGGAALRMLTGDPLPAVEVLDGGG